MAKLLGALLGYGVPIVLLISGVGLVCYLATGLLLILRWPE